jgi:superfamily II DNA or RNA helicase
MAKPVISEDEIIYHPTYINSSYKSSMISINGYSILKEELTDPKIREIKRELEFKPFDISGYNKFINDKFSLFRENDKRVFMPRFYGLQKFGIPAKDKLMLQEDNKLDIIKKFEKISSKEIKKIKEKSVTEQDKFNAHRLEIQYSAKKEVIHRLKTVGGGLLVLPCGYGKTRTSIEIWAKMKVPVIIFVHKEFLMEQWEEEIKSIVDCKIGKIQGKRFDVDDCDVVIAMIQTFIKKEFDVELLKRFQMIMADECHHLAAPIFNQCLGKVSTKYILGLSATPDRSDKLEQVFKHYLGPTIYEYKLPPNNRVDVEVYYIKNTDQKYYKNILNKQDKPNKSKMLTNICKYPERNEFIIDLVAKHVKAGRSILVISGRRGDKKSKLQDLIKTLDEYIREQSKLSGVKYGSLIRKTNYKDWTLDDLNTALLSRKLSEGMMKYCNQQIEYYKKNEQGNEFNEEMTDSDQDSDQENEGSGTVKHLELMATKLKDKYGIPSLIYAGGDKVEKLKQMDTLNVLFSVYPMVNEGFNCKKLNTLIMATPTNDTRQIRGRIMRQMTDEYNPLIIDIVDSFSNFVNNATKRVTDYVKNGYKVSKYIWNSGEIIPMEKVQPRKPKIKSITDASKYLKMFDAGKIESVIETGKEEDEELDSHTYNMLMTSTMEIIPRNKKVCLID